MKKQIELQDQTSGDYYQVTLFFNDVDGALEKSELSILPEPKSMAFVKGYAITIVDGVLSCKKEAVNPLLACYKKSKTVTAVLTILDTQLRSIESEYRIHNSFELFRSDSLKACDNSLSVIKEYLLENAPHFETIENYYGFHVK